MLAQQHAPMTSAASAALPHSRLHTLRSNPLLAGRNNMGKHVSTRTCAQPLPAHQQGRHTECQGSLRLPPSRKC